MRVNAVNEGPPRMAAGKRQRRTVWKSPTELQREQPTKAVAPKDASRNTSYNTRVAADPDQAGTVQQADDASVPSVGSVRVTRHHGSGRATIGFTLPEWMLYYPMWTPTIRLTGFHDLFDSPVGVALPAEGSTRTVVVLVTAERTRWPEARKRFGKRMSVKPQPDESFYSLPNQRFSISDVSMPPYYSEVITRKFGTISGSTSGFAKDQSALLGAGNGGLVNPARRRDVDNDPGPHIPHPALRAMVRALVGGTLLLFPNHVELVAFCPRYLESPIGVWRLAHWAECGQQHVMIFLASLVTVLWYHYALGLSLTSIVVSGFMFVWHAFKVNKSIPLGEDDQQSLYLVIMGLLSTDGLFSKSCDQPKAARSLEAQDPQALPSNPSVRGEVPNCMMKRVTNCRSHR
ncbi:hypothetical protein HD554DRAFT_2040949 [Boletus coccyginus]|nr:hypothetical protein HD554DRAFT_2040949 [Boletus coccyginus]